MHLARRQKKEDTLRGARLYAFVECSCFESKLKPSSDRGLLGFDGNNGTTHAFIFCSSMQVCEEQSCEDVVFPCAMNYLDRFLARTNVKKNHLQLLGAVCLLIASKIRQSRPISVEALVYYTDYSVTVEEIKVTFGSVVLSLSRSTGLFLDSLVSRGF